MEVLASHPRVCYKQDCKKILEYLFPWLCSTLILVFFPMQVLKHWHLCNRVFVHASTWATVCRNVCVPTKIILVSFACKNWNNSMHIVLYFSCKQLKYNIQDGLLMSRQGIFAYFSCKFSDNMIQKDLVVFTETIFGVASQLCLNVWLTYYAFIAQNPKYFWGTISFDWGYAFFQGDACLTFSDLEMKDQSRGVLSQRNTSETVLFLAGKAHGMSGA